MQWSVPLNLLRKSLGHPANTSTMSSCHCGLPGQLKNAQWQTQMSWPMAMSSRTKSFQPGIWSSMRFSLKRRWRMAVSRQRKSIKHWRRNTMQQRRVWTRTQNEEGRLPKKCVAKCWRARLTRRRRQSGWRGGTRSIGCGRVSVSLSESVKKKINCLRQGLRQILSHVC